MLGHSGLVRLELSGNCVRLVVLLCDRGSILIYDLWLLVSLMHLGCLSYWGFKVTALASQLLELPFLSLKLYYFLVIWLDPL